MSKVIALQVQSKHLRNRPKDERRLGVLMKGVFAFKEAKSDVERRRIIAETNSILRRISR